MERVVCHSQHLEPSMSTGSSVSVCVCIFWFFVSVVINAVHRMLSPTTRYSVQSKILLESVLFELHVTSLWHRSTRCHAAV